MYNIHLHPHSGATGLTLELGQLDAGYLGSTFTVGLGGQQTAEITLKPVGGGPTIQMFGTVRNSAPLYPVCTNGVDNLVKFTGFTLYWYGSWFVLPHAGALTVPVGNRKWADNFISNFTPAITPGWSNGATIDTADTGNKTLMFIVSVAAHGNNTVEFEVELQSGITTGSYVTLQSWRYHISIVASGTYSVPFTMMHGIVTSHRYYRTRIRRANAQTGTHRDTNLIIMEVPSI